MGGGGGGGKTKLPGEAKPFFWYGKPMAKQMGEAATGGQPLWQVPGMPQAPGPVLPTEQYFQSVAPQIQQALWQPYGQVFQQTLETMGGQGQLGSQRGGFSGASGAAAGTFAAEVAPRMAAQAWQMGAPELQRYGQQQYMGQLQQRGEELQALQAPWSMYPSYMGGAGAMPLVHSPASPSIASRLGPLGGMGAGLGIAAALGGGLPGLALGGGLGLMGGQTLFGGK
ncbi:MAG: hypothetical protein ACXABD_19560 [Candidatus Thorarchaeota archaeon]|jgi:hypothetical protein